MIIFKFVLRWVLTKKNRHRIHHEIRFRNVNYFDLSASIVDNEFNLFENILGISDPDSALHLWVQIFLLSLISMLHIVLNE